MASIGHYTDPWWWLEFSLENPRQAAKLVGIGLAILVVTVISLAVEAVPLWIAGYVIAAVFFVFAYREYQTLSLLRAADAETADSLTPGPTNVSGTVVPATDDLPEAPHSAEECVVYRHERIRKRSGHEGNTTRSTESEAVPFYVEDDTGRTLVEASNCRPNLTLDDGQRIVSHRGEREYRLEPGDSVTVYGEAVRPGTARVGSGPDSEREGEGENRSEADAGMTEMVRGMAEMASEIPGQYDHLFAEEPIVIGTGPQYGMAMLTDKRGIRVYGRQVLIVLGLLAAGGLMAAVSASWMLGYSLFQ